MRGDFVALCTSVSVVTAEVDQRVVAPYDTRPGPRSGFTDSALLPVRGVAALVGRAAATRCLASRRRTHPGRFPRLPARARDHRRRRQLAEATNRLRGAVRARRWRVLAADGADRCARDRVPVPVVGCHHARHDHRWYGAAASGRGAATQQPLDGGKRHRRSSASGLVRACALVAANAADSTLAEQRLSDKAGRTVRGDQGDSDGPLPQLLAARNGLAVLTPRRTNQQAQRPAALTRASSHARQLIAPVNRQLVNHVALQRNRAQAVWGLAARVHAKLAAHTLGLYLNHFAGRPLLALMDLALI